MKGDRTQPINPNPYNYGEGKDYDLIDDWLRDTKEKEGPKNMIELLLELTANWPAPKEEEKE